MTDEEQRAVEAVRSAIRKFNLGQPPDEPCVFCGQPIVVEGWPKDGPVTLWMTHCPCKKSNSTWKGL